GAHMATEVTLPELGESVTEGTIIAWLGEVGDTVEADQPLFELSSDKIDTEVPSPVSGVVKETRVDVDETVEVGTVVAIIDDGDGAAAGDDGDAEADAEAGEQAAEEAEAEAAEEPEAEAAEEQAAEDEGTAPADGGGGGGGGEVTDVTLPELGESV